MVEFAVGVGVGTGIGAGVMWYYKCRCDNQWSSDIVRDGTQAFLVREYLERGNKLDHKYAREHLGIKNLSSAVDKLRKAGVDVKVNKDNNGSFYTL
jgi:hypothetical protein